MTVSPQNFLSLPVTMPDFVPGTVWIVGAGPGDAGLLTLLACHGMHHADCVIYDALVGEDVLKLARPDAEFERVRHALRQDIALLQARLWPDRTVS